MGRTTEPQRPFLRCVLTDIGSEKGNKKDADASKLTLSREIDPYFVDANGVPLLDGRWTSGSLWTQDIVSGLTFTATAPLATATAATTATVVFNAPIGGTAPLHLHGGQVLLGADDLAGHGHPGNGHGQLRCGHHPDHRPDHGDHVLLPGHRHRQRQGPRPSRRSPTPACSRNTSCPGRTYRLRPPGLLHPQPNQPAETQPKEADMTQPTNTGVQAAEQAKAYDSVFPPAS